MSNYAQKMILVWIASFWFFMWLMSGCATASPRPEKPVGELCEGFYIEFHSKEPYPILPVETMYEMMRTCRTIYQGCLSHVIQSTKYENSWYAICRRDANAQRP